MTKRVQQQKTKSQARREAEQTKNVQTSSSDELKADLDDVLDEIDAVLEENAQEFVDGYIQKGGE